MLSHTHTHSATHTHTLNLSHNRNHTKPPPWLLPSFPMAYSLSYNSSSTPLNLRHLRRQLPTATLPSSLFFLWSRPLNLALPGAASRQSPCCRAPGPVVGPSVRTQLVGDTKTDSEKILRVGVICGGPSAERGISLNSARSVLDHIQGDDLQISCYYIDYNLNAYAISSAQMYSNTPADFDFKLDSLAQGFESLSEFAHHLAATVDIVFPVIHGRFGEDGGIQELLEKFDIPFVGTQSRECRKAFDKYDASLELERQGFVTVPSVLVQGSEMDEAELSKWFARYQLDTEQGKVVICR